ncbi:hypothetical protein JKP88DRAFT_289547 [Tribonema minus]|uniref:SET domain-containing protein n=1 Tax=Tribonema minus TaxID=303371 RepID=A0A836CFX8_9STRA|nr:hypothetical protein JKP88DRAFT_289547 [Tribonema minus]
MEDILERADDLFEVRQSPISGLGVFAKTDISPGELLIYTAKVCPTSLADHNMYALNGYYADEDGAPVPSSEYFFDGTPATARGGILVIVEPVPCGAELLTFYGSLLQRDYHVNIESNGSNAEYCAKVDEAYDHLDRWLQDAAGSSDSSDDEEGEWSSDDGDS